MDPGHKARKNPSDNADLGFQAVGPALRIMQLNVEGLSAFRIRKEEDYKRFFGNFSCFNRNEWKSGLLFTNKCELE